ncbi:MAG: PadR family transcriptional regulator [Chloroflexota bacterium]|nr:PadR family transcriptional regulator [Chloroflexota bacterium]
MKQNNKVTPMNLDLSELGRFSEPALLILVSLAPGAKHGYAIMEDIKTMTGTEMRAGTLYAALNRLERHSLIEPLPAEDRRKPYRLTAEGATALHDQLTNLGSFAKMGLQRLATV